MGEQKITILIVDDENDFRQLMKFWLQSKGYNVLEASHGQQALDILQQQTPDMMFLDLRMPGLDGVETIKRIREMNRDLPVIVISAYVEDTKAKEAAAYGVSGVFYKGSDLNEGSALLESVLRTHKKLKK